MPLSTEGVRNVKSLLNAATSEGPTGAPGLVFIAVDKSGKTLVEHAAGTNGVNSKERVDLDTTFWIASMTKIVTTIAVLQLNEQGRLPLDDADFVKKIAPELQEKKVYADGIVPADQKQAVTVRMLLAHTAGFSYSFLDTRTRVNAISGDIKDIIASPMVNQPGSMWEYGINIDWAGIILERVTGTRLGDYFQQHIFEPLGVKDTTMHPTKAMKENFGQMHQRDPNGTLRESEWHPYSLPLKVETKEDRDKIFHAGGHGLFSKPREYVKILAALLNDGTSPTTGAQILKPATVETMTENQIRNQPDFARGGPPPAIPTLANQTPDIYPQEGNPPQGWGLSWFLTIAPGPTGRGANTGWWAGLPNLYFWVDREKGVAGVIASQVLPFGDAKVFGTWIAAEKAIQSTLVRTINPYQAKCIVISKYRSNDDD